MNVSGAASDNLCRVLACLVVQHGRWTIRIDPPRCTGGQKHGHAREKGLKGEWSWNLDGSRHDASKFPADGSPGSSKAREFVAKHLGVDKRRLRLVFQSSVKAGSAVCCRDGHNPTRASASFYCPRDSTVLTVIGPARRLLVLVVVEGLGELCDASEAGGRSEPLPRAGRR
jgi:hypothetical protein